jgi:trehalose 6-phosphate synthase/phosphatase
MPGNTPGAKPGASLSLRLDELRNPQLQSQSQPPRPAIDQRGQPQGHRSEYHDDTPRPPASTDRAFEAVTPGMQPSTYVPPQSPASAAFNARPSYFNQPGPSSAAPSTARPNSVLGLLQRRVTTDNMAHRESLSDIRAANPDLLLSGNIISATFNIPHSFTYRKGGDWVSILPA